MAGAVAGAEAEENKGDGLAWEQGKLEVRLQSRAAAPAGHPPAALFSQTAATLSSAQMMRSSPVPSSACQSSVEVDGSVCEGASQDCPLCNLES